MSRAGDRRWRLLLRAGAFVGAAAAAPLASAAAGGPDASEASWISQALLWLIGLILCVLLPLSSFAMLRMIAAGGAGGTLPPRGRLYLDSAVTWAVIAGLCLGAALDPGTGLPLAWLAAPTSPPAGAGLAAAAGIVAALAWWTRDVAGSRTKRAFLRALYRRGSHAVAPRQPRELAWFRAMALVTSTAEEIAYRLVLLALAGAAFGPAAGLLASSIIFGLAHMYQGARGLAYTVLFGVVAGFLTLWTENIWPAIVLHAGWNMAMSGAIYAVYRGRSA